MKISEIDELFEKCWKGYEKKGMKTMFGKRVPNCVKKESIEVSEGMPEMAPVYPNIKSGINDAYNTIDEIDYVIVRLQKTIAEEYGDDIPDEYQKPLDFIIDIMNKKLPSAIRHIADIAKDDEVYESINEDLRAWFGKGKKGGAGGGGWDRYNTKGERVGKCGLQTESLEVDESEYDAFDIMHEDPPIGVDFDMDNLPKVDWSKHSPEEIKSFYSTIENLDFDDSKDITGTGYSGAWAEALKWLDDNVMNKLDKEHNLEE